MSAIEENGSPPEARAVLPTGSGGGAYPDDGSPRRWLKLIDQTRCIGCHACTTACKSENEVPLSVTRTYVKNVDVGVFPQARRAYQVTRCNQCEDAPCVAACPTGAMFARPDGIVDFDKSACIGCKACMAACPYDAIFINPEDHSAEKCNFCAHRIDMGLEPACVVVCPTQAIIIGQTGDPLAGPLSDLLEESPAARTVQREPVAVRRPEKGTRPKLFYRGATQATLDPLAARRPSGDTLMWSEIPRSPHLVTSGHPGDGRRGGSGGSVGADGSGGAGRSGGANSSAAALLSYDIGHSVPWDWRVSFYTWTKGIAGGAYLVAVLLALTGVWRWTDPLATWAAPIIAAAFLAATAGILVWDLEHPARFFYVLTRPQWRSWLVRGGFVLAAYATVLALHLLGALLGTELGTALLGDVRGDVGLRQALAAPGVPLGARAYVYTAYLFAQAKARDLWQSPLLPPHLLVQAVLAGAAALLPVAVWAQPDAAVQLGWVLAAATAAHLLLVLGEVTVSHPTEHAKLAAREMTSGRYARFFRAGVLLGAAGLVAPFAADLSGTLAGVLVAPLALAGLALYEHAYVQAGQSVPLA